MIAAAMLPAGPSSELRRYTLEDEPWIEQLLDVVERSAGEPWRILLERIDATPLRASPPWIAGIVGALRRVLGGRAVRARIARRVRAAVLGHPALDPDARAARLALAATELGLEPADVEALLWADLARERPVTLPHGRPAASTLVAFANVDRIQRAVRRARELELRVGGDAHRLVRLAARYGLMASISRDRSDTVLRVAGPLELFHATTVYGRALAALVPLLAEQPRFTLDIHGAVGDRTRTLRLEPPVLLPPVRASGQASGRARPSLAERLARDLAAAGCGVEREPAPIASGAHVLFPDLAVDHLGRRWFVELVGFSTDGYVTDKLARYRAAGTRVVLCLDAARAPADGAGREGVVRFVRRIDAGDLCREFERAP